MEIFNKLPDGLVVHKAEDDDDVKNEQMTNIKYIN